MTIKLCMFTFAFALIKICKVLKLPNKVLIMMELKNAVQYLYGKGIIKKDKDIADKLDYNKATVSSYISGRTKPSADFLQKFEKGFRVALKDFAKGGNMEPIPASDPLQLLSEKIIQLVAITRVNQSLLVEVLASQQGKTVMELQRVAAEAMDAELKLLLAELKQAAVSAS